MNKLFKILFSVIAAGLFTAAVSGNEPASLINFYTVKVQASDKVLKHPLLDVHRFRLNIVPPSSGVRFYKEGIIYLSNSKNEGRVPSNHVSFGTTEAYYAELVDTVLRNRKVFSVNSLFNFPCEAVTFNNDYTLMYYTGRSGNTVPEQIFQAEIISSPDGESVSITDSEPLSFCNGRSIFTHPALSGDGNLMVFASDTEGSLGAMDLFVTRKEGNNWSSPENLGNNINTGGDELYPFLDAENNLFFSSDGLDGAGGYDIFISKFNGKSWDKPENMGRYINTKGDEMAFVLNPSDRKSAFFTLRQGTGRKQLQLQMVTFKNKQEFSKLTNLSDAFVYLASLDRGQEEKQVAATAEKELLAAAKTEPVEAPVTPVKEPEKKIVAVSAQKEKPADVKITPGPEKKAVSEAAPGEDVIVYRVQFASKGKPDGNNKVTFGGQTYTTYEYFYAGAYRLCAGEFSNYTSAAVLRKVVRQGGYPDAFVVAFRNNQRTLDQSLFR